MARPLRIEFDGAWYHVMNRGLERRDIFIHDYDRKLFFDLLKDISQLFSVEVHAFSLMDNHYHLLIHTPTAGLSRALRHLNGVYTQKFNKSHGRDGPLFCGRYKAILVNEDEYLTELVRYIHLNPVEAGLCHHPKDHPWTSHRHYLSNKRGFEWLKTDEVLSHFGRKENLARRKLNEFVLMGLEKKTREKIENPGLGIIGNKDFKEWVLGNFVSAKKKEDREIGFKNRWKRTSLKYSQILRDICFVYHVAPSDIKRLGQGRYNEARQMAIYQLRNLLGMPHKEIATVTGTENEYAVALAYHRFKKRQEKDRRIKKLSKEVEQIIRRHSDK